MPRPRFGNALRIAALALPALLGGAGCHALHEARYAHPGDQAPGFDSSVIPDVAVPKELNKVSLPPYIVETPDVLQIDAIRVIPLPPYRVAPLDVLAVSAENDFEGARLAGRYPVDPAGAIDLGPRYGGPVPVADLTTEEARELIERKVRQFAPKAVVMVALARSRGAEQLSGRHVVRADGTVNLGSYGSVYVAGLSLAHVKQAVEAHLAEFLWKPEVLVDVSSSNSKFYYVITDFAGGGEQVARLPHTGNETVLDAVALVGGLPAVSSKTLWVARPAPTECGDDQILPVDWSGITRKGQVKTNYQILPGDRVYILSRPPAKPDTGAARMFAPARCTFGVPLPVAGAGTPNCNNTVGFGIPSIP